MSADPSVTLEYVVDGTADDFAVKALVLRTAPPTYDGLEMKSAEISPMGRPDLWAIVVNYSKPVDDEDKLSYSWDTSGATFNVKQALDQRGYPRPGGNPAPNFKNAINVTSDREVKGQDIVIPRLTWQETHTFPANLLTPAWLMDVARNTGKTNESDFRQFSPGEVLFLGASGSYSDNHVAVTYKFEASENQTNIDVGGINVVRKDGHEYLWTFYSEEEDAEAKAIVPRPFSVHVAEIYQAFDFADLGIANSSLDKRRENENEQQDGFGGGD
jgi:hypothetical protein